VLYLLPEKIHCCLIDKKDKTNMPDIP